jgi:serine phosphatase RsbU (regulator of sigma subunit)
LDKGIKLAFSQSEKEFETDQGMDLSLVRIDRKQKVLRFAGAQRPLFMVQGGELKELEGEKVSISCAVQMNADPFQTQQLDFETGTVIYLFSDGIVDQFGGARGKKFMQRRLRDFINEHYQLPLSEQATALDRVFDEWKGSEHDQLDDVMLMAIQL